MLRPRGCCWCSGKLGAEGRLLRWAPPHHHTLQDHDTTSRNNEDLWKLANSARLVLQSTRSSSAAFDAPAPCWQRWLGPQARLPILGSTTSLSTTAHCTGVLQGRATTHVDEESLNAHACRRIWFLSLGTERHGYGCSGLSLSAASTRSLLVLSLPYRQAKERPVYPSSISCTNRENQTKEADPMQCSKNALLNRCCDVDAIISKYAMML